MSSSSARLASLLSAATSAREEDCPLSPKMSSGIDNLETQEQQDSPKAPAEANIIGKGEPSREESMKLDEHASTAQHAVDPDAIILKDVVNSESVEGHTAEDALPNQPKSKPVDTSTDTTSVKSNFNQTPLPDVRKTSSTTMATTRRTAGRGRARSLSLDSTLSNNNNKGKAASSGNKRQSIELDALKIGSYVYGPCASEQSQQPPSSEEQHSATSEQISKGLSLTFAFKG